MSDQDLSQGNTLKVRVRVVSGTAKAKLFIKAGANWAWASTDEVELTGEYQWITLSLNGKDFNGEAIDKTLIKAVGLQISSPNGQGKMTVYVDDVTLDEKELAAGAGETSLPEKEQPGRNQQPTKRNLPLRKSQQMKKAAQAKKMFLPVKTRGYDKPNGIKTDVCLKSAPAGCREGSRQPFLYTIY